MTNFCFGTDSKLLEYTDDALIIMYQIIPLLVQEDEHMTAYRKVRRSH